MKKISLTLIFLLVFGLACTVKATITMELREDDGVTPASYLLLGSDYVLVISGASADAGASLGLYGTTYTAADWAVLGPPNSTTTVVDTGDLSYIYWTEGWYGYDMVVGDSGSGPGVSTGDWFTIDLTCLTEPGVVCLCLLDYGANSTVIGGIHFYPLNVCFPCYHPDYQAWLDRGSPISWCNPRQCHGDADGEMETRGKQDFWVGYPDLDLFLAGFPIPTTTYVDEYTHPWIAADFDHDIEVRGKLLFYVGYPDLDIFLANFPIPGDGIAPDCLDVP